MAFIAGPYTVSYAGQELGVLSPPRPISDGPPWCLCGKKWFLRQLALIDRERFGCGIQFQDVAAQSFEAGDYVTLNYHHGSWHVMTPNPYDVNLNVMWASEDD